MKFAFHVSPNLQSPRSTQQIMRDLTLALGVVFAVSVIYYFVSYGANYGLHALLLLAASLVTALVCESIFAKVKKKDIKSFVTHNFSWVTCLILVMMVPISTPVYVIIVATVFAVAVARLMFGGFGNNIFNPAGVGRAVIFASFSGSAVSSLMTSSTPATVLNGSFKWMPGTADALNSFLNYIGGWGSLFFGTYAGAIGETFSLLILIAGIYLIWRNVIDWRIPVVYLGTIFVITSIVAMLEGIDSWNGIPGFIWYPLIHLLTGGVIFGAVFMLTDPVTIPTMPQGRVFFAMMAAVITVLIRLKGNYPEGCLFSILIMNTFTPLIEQALCKPQLQQKKKAWIMTGCAAILALCVAFYAASTIKPVKGAKNITYNYDTNAEVISIENTEEVQA
jgi:electron transport complex protein RnfD